ncbi:hypothetical protein D3C80_829280 [compost metagenome]
MPYRARATWPVGMIGTHLADFIMVGVIKTQKKPDICLQYLFTFFQEKHWRYRERPYMRDCEPPGTGLRRVGVLYDFHL